jgi:hypothetical protein
MRPGEVLVFDGQIANEKTDKTWAEAKRKLRKENSQGSQRGQHCVEQSTQQCHIH